MASDGISRLIAVTQMKAQNANDESLRGADRQRKLLEQRKGQNSGKASFHDLAKAEQQRALMELQSRLPGFRRSLSPAAAALLDQWLLWASERR